MVFNRGWNLIGWSQDYATYVETLGQCIPGYTLATIYDSLNQ